MRELPEEYTNVMITYEGMVRYNSYGDRRKEVVTRRAFYSKSNGYYNSSNEWVNTPEGYFNVPQYWSNWTFSDGTSAILPQRFSNYGRVLPNEVIGWKYDK